MPRSTASRPSAGRAPPIRMRGQAHWHQSGVTWTMSTKCWQSSLWRPAGGFLCLKRLQRFVEVWAVRTTHSHARNLMFSSCKQCQGWSKGINASKSKAIQTRPGSLPGNRWWAHSHSKRGDRKGRVARQETLKSHNYLNNLNHIGKSPESLHVQFSTRGWV